MNFPQYVWLAFTAIFVALAVWHWRTARRALPHLPKAVGIKAVNGVTIGNVENVAAMNAHIDKVNEDSRRANFAACGGYVAAALTAFASYWFEAHGQVPSTADLPISAPTNLVCKAEGSVDFPLRLDLAAKTIALRRGVTKAALDGIVVNGEWPAGKPGEVDTIELDRVTLRVTWSQAGLQPQHGQCRRVEGGF